MASKGLYTPPLALNLEEILNELTILLGVSFYFHCEKIYIK